MWAPLSSPSRTAVALIGALACAAMPSLGAAPAPLPLGDFVQSTWDAGERSLPHPTVTSIVQTNDGYLWLGTFAGLSRFDGQEFVGLRDAGPALADHVRCLLAARDGALWIGTKRYGVVRLQGSQRRVYTHEGDGLHANDVRSLAQTSDGAVWVGTSAGLTRVAPDGVARPYDAAPPNVNVNALFADSRGGLWIGTAGSRAGGSEFGLWRLDGERLSRVPLILERPYDPTAPIMSVLLFPAVWSFAEDAEGGIWIGTTRGAVHFDAAGGPRTEHTHIGGVAGVWPARDGALWFATTTGVHVLKDGAWSRYDAERGLLHDNVLAVREDREGNVWMGTRLGLVRLAPKQIRTLTERDGLADDYVNAVLESRSGDVWAATQNGVTRIGTDGRTRTFRVADGLPHSTATSIAEAPDGTLWFGTVNGLARYREGRFSTYGDRIRGYRISGLAIAPDGQPWATLTDGSVYRLSGDVFELVAPHLCHDPYLRSLLFTRDGHLWIGGTSSLVQGRGEPREWTCLDSRTEPVAANDIRYLREDADGSVWTAGVGGLARRHPNGTIERFRGSTGPFDSIAYSVLDDGRGHLWTSTPKGVFRIALRTLRSDRVDEALYRHYGRPDGLETSACNGDGQPTAWRGARGRLYFTSVKGLVVADLDQRETAVPFPAVYVESIRTDRGTFEPREPLRLAPGTRDIEIHYAAVSLSQGPRVRYRYRLDDAAWTEAGARRVAHYAHVRPGTHRFEVMAMNRDGIWSPESAAVAFELTPRLRERAWFYPVLAFGLATFALFGYRFRVARLRRRADELERGIQEAIASIRELRSLLPACAWCHKVRDDGGYWGQLEDYVARHWGTDLSHGICPECLQKVESEIDQRRLLR